MTPSKNLIPFIKKWEGCKLTAYDDNGAAGGGTWTVGFGSIMYKDGHRVKEGDVITMEQAEELLMWEINLKALSVQAFCYNVVLNQNKFDALCDFAYNCGVGALEHSTLLKRVRINPSDPLISDAFMMWNKVKSNGVLHVSDWQTRRRRAESVLYFS